MNEKIINPYLDEVKDFIFDTEYQYNNLVKRSQFVLKYSWSIPTEEAIEEIIKLGPIVEAGAGTGYWASLISKMGGDIIAYDIDPPEFSKNKYNHTTQYFKVEQGDHIKVSEYSYRSLLLCWAPYSTSMGYDHISSYKGDTLILVGEGYGGCCGDDKMFNYIEKNFDSIKSINLPQWYGLHDYVEIFKRK
jgi:hypothetical protein